MADAKVLSPTQLSQLYQRVRSTVYAETNASSRQSATGSGQGVNSTGSFSSISPSMARIITLSWSPLGTLVATGSTDRKLRVWNPERPKNPIILTPSVVGSTVSLASNGSVKRVDFNPMHEAELASCHGGSDGMVRVWDVRSRRCSGSLKLGKELLSVCWAPKGREMLVGTQDDYLVRIDRRQMQVLNDGVSGIAQEVELVEMERTEMMDGQTNHCAFSHDEKFVFVTSGDGSVKVATWPELHVLQTIKGHTSNCFVTTLSPTGRVLAVGGSDALVTLWDTSSWYCLRALTHMQGAVKALSFSFDGGYIIAGGDDDSTLDIVHVESGASVHKIENTGSIGAVGWSPKDYTIAYAASEGKMSGGLRIVTGTGMVVW